ncbi:hypothetical protein LSTR_LSTR002616 [Laodelphax striatellus]|uniref:Uncharacterized protein n=1 Tax=Laodelphax striatellus TaxID=195883 RepID=A0A482XLQ1_LAOST|nr:hypothetical protein LSTR_LSTR002616 [Laodelphax striatellus]
MYTNNSFNQESNQASEGLFKEDSDDEDSGNEYDPASMNTAIQMLSDNSRNVFLQLLDILFLPGFPAEKEYSIRIHPDNALVRVPKFNVQPGNYLGRFREKDTFLISEHMSPQEFLRQTGFSDFQARNLCLGFRLKAKLVAAINEASVWLNCINQYQALLLYGLAVKMKPENMPPLFVQLVEAIANRRIVNMLTLFEYIRILKKLKRYPIQSEIKQDLAQKIVAKQQRRLM